MTTRSSGQSTLGHRLQDPRDQILQETPIDDINQLEATIQRIGFCLPDAHDEVADVINLRNKVDELLSKNRELMELRCQGRARKVKGSMGKLLQTQGLKDWAQKLDNACRVLETSKANIASLQRYRHDGEVIPVEVEYQREFLGLLKAAAKDRGQIASCVNAMEWIAKTRETTSIWRKHLDEQLDAGTSLEAAWYEQQKLADLIVKFTQDSFSSDASQSRKGEGESLETMGVPAPNENNMMDLG